VYCSVILRVLHQLFRMNFNSVLLSLHTVKIFASVRNSIFNHYFCNVCEVLLHYLNDIIQIFQEWLFTIFKKYWYSVTNKNNELHMSMKTRMRMLVFFLLMIWFHLLMNLIRTQILHMFLLFSMMKIDFSRVVILWRSHSFVKLKWTNYQC